MTLKWTRTPPSGYKPEPVFGERWFLTRQVTGADSARVVLRLKDELMRALDGKTDAKGGGA